MSDLAFPLRRNGRDFASATTDEAIRHKLRLLLMTRPGELMWRPEFGVGLDALRHMPSGPVLTELARVRIRDAMRQYLPSLELLSVTATTEDSALHLRITYRTPTRNDALEVTR